MGTTPSTEASNQNITENKDNEIIIEKTANNSYIANTALVFSPSTYLACSPSLLSVGTISQSGTTVTGSGFTSSMVGGVIVYTTGGAYTSVVSVQSSTSLTADISQTVASTSASIYYGGFQTNSSGATTNIGSGSSSTLINNGSLVTGTTTVSGSVKADTIDQNTGSALSIGPTIATQVNIAGSSIPTVINSAKVTMPNKIAFDAYYSGSGISNVTGDNTAYTVIFGTTTINNGSAYSTSTGIFTAPYAGLYQFNVSVYFNNISSSHTLGQVALSINNSGSNLQSTFGNPANMKSANSDMVMNVSATYYLNVNDNVRAVLTVRNSTKTIGLGQYSWNRFSGYLVG